MTLTRIYLPLNAAGLHMLGADRFVTGAPLRAHAVTETVRASSPNAAQDELEYAALGDAARSSVRLLTAGEDRRIVAAADVDTELVGPVASVAPQGALVESAVLISASVALNRIASFHIDAAGATHDDELLWYDVTELPVILAFLSA